MRDAWIYAADADDGATLGRQLARLGYRPRQVRANGALRPPGGVRAPELVVVHGRAELCPRVRADAEIGDVPLLLSLAPADVDPAHLEADELLVAPFTLGELEARIVRAQRRAHGSEEPDVVRAGDLALNLATYEVTVAGAPVELTNKEYALLKFLLTRPDRVFSREALLSAVWGYDYLGGGRTVDVHVGRLRAKLGAEHAARIVTVRSVGYRWAG